MGLWQHGLVAYAPISDESTALWSPGSQKTMILLHSCTHGNTTMRAAAPLVGWVILQILTYFNKKFKNQDW